MTGTIRNQVYPVYVGLVVIAIAAATMFTTRTFVAFFRSEKERELTEQAELLSRLAPADIFTTAQRKGSGPEGGADRFIGSAGAAVSGRITIILPDGTVAGDTGEDPSVMENHADRPEIAAALSGRTGVSRRTSATLSREMVYVAVPVREAGRIIGVVRVSAGISEIDRALGEYFRRSVLFGFVLVVATSLVSFLVVKRIVVPIEQMRRAASRYARGELEYRFSIDGPLELRTLAETMNAMADQLRMRIRTIMSQRNELDAILSNMVEAVVVLDGFLRIRSMNRAAEALFGLRAARVESIPILDVLRNAELADLAEKVLRERAPVEENLILYGNPPLHLQIHGTILSTEAVKNAGVLLVMNDVSRLRKLEEIRKEFVANVSHELKTPITSIRGFVEALREGALDDRQTAEHFLGIIEKHTERLASIIDDLLALSRLEQNEGNAIRFESSSIRSVVEEAVAFCVPAAAAKSITLERSFPDGPLPARVNPVLLEQAVMNLIDNGVKYSPNGSVVRIRVEADPGLYRISVADAGTGIPAKDLPRIFERFYRIDKARSRALGGTGLGLAIVKHIMSVHRGEVTVESEPGSGSTFTLMVPSGLGG